MYANAANEFAIKGKAKNNWNKKLPANYYIFTPSPCSINSLLLSSDFFCNFLPRKWYYYLKSDKDGNKWYALTERKCALLKGD